MIPLITIITASRNAEKNIKQSMESVFAQTYPYIEYIVVDGRSTDGAIAIPKNLAIK